MAERMKKTRLSFRKSRWQRSDTNEIKPDYNNAFTVLGVLLTELANAAAAVLLTVCAAVSYTHLDVYKRQVYR